MGITFSRPVSLSDLETAVCISGRAQRALPACSTCVAWHYDGSCPPSRCRRCPSRPAYAPTCLTKISSPSPSPLNTVRWKPMNITFLEKTPRIKKTNTPILFCGKAASFSMYLFLLVYFCLCKPRCPSGSVLEWLSYFSGLSLLKMALPYQSPLHSSCNRDLFSVDNWPLLDFRCSLTV
jgi:hypothetical protein